MQALHKIFNQLPDRMYPNRKNDSHIFTPLTIAKEMIDALPDDIWNSKSTFLDICCKSGALLYEIYAKLMNSKDLIIEFPDTGERRKHIVNKQIFGISPDQACQLLSTRAVYGCIVENSHIIYLENYTNVMTNSDTRFLIETLKREFGTMKFDVVVGNPPYNKGMDLDFVDTGYKLLRSGGGDTGYLCMITPAKWQTAAADQKVASKNINYGQFREKYVPHMSHVCFYPDAPDIFDIAQTDGITYFTIDLNMHTEATIENKCNRQSFFNSTETRKINNQQSLLNIGAEIISFINNIKPCAFKLGSMNKRYKVYTASKVSKGASPHMFASDGKTQYLGISRIIDSNIQSKPEQECSQSFSADTLEECKSFVSYINTRFVRFLLICNVSRLNGIICNDCFRFVPAPPTDKFDHIYTDEELYKAFNLPQKYIDVIESVIKERK